MTLADRLAELIERADRRGVNLADLEIWEPVSLALAVGAKLGLTPEQVLAPVDE